MTMATTEPRIDLTRLLKVRRTGSKVVAQCPACHAAGNDRSGEHFYLNAATGKWGCGCLPGDTEHRREIFRLIGIRGERRPDPERDRRWRLERDAERRRQAVEKSLADAAARNRAGIVARHLWSLADVQKSSPQRIDDPLVESDPRHFLKSLFRQDAIVWTGEHHHSGSKHAAHWLTTADHFRPVSDWTAQPVARLGPMTSPATWPEGIVNRNAANVLVAPYVVVEFDGVGGIKPTGSQAIGRHVLESLALIRWLRESLRWELAAMVFSGSVSVHAWFHSPSIAALASLKTAATALGIDSGLIGRPEHPCRLPGQRHAKTGNLSRVLWLQSPVHADKPKQQTTPNTQTP